MKTLSTFHPTYVESLKIVMDEIDPNIYMYVVTEHNIKIQEIDRLNFNNYDTY